MVVAEPYYIATADCSYTPCRGFVTFQKLNVLNRTLVIGRRWNVKWKNLSLHLPEQVAYIGKTCGKIHKQNAVDYFVIAKNDFPWAHLPDVVIARRGYDNFVVMLAVQQNVSVVDISDTVVALHQTDAEAQDKRRHAREHEFNMRRLPRFRSTKGLTSSSQYLTKAVTDTVLRNITNIVIMQRRTIRRYGSSASVTGVGNETRGYDRTTGFTFLQ